MTPPVMRNARHAGPAQCSSTAATSKVAPISVTTLASSSTAMYFGTSASTAWSGAAAWLPDVASSFAPARETRISAVSALAHSPANSASAAAARISQPIARLSLRSRRSGLRWHVRPAVGSPGSQQPVLQAEHGSMLSGVGMVIPEQVQDAMGGEQVDLIRDAMASPPGLPRSNLRANHHISKQNIGPIGIEVARLRMRSARLRRPELIHRESEHVRWPFLALPPDVQLGHGRLVDQQQRQLGERVHAHLVEYVPGEPGQRGFVDVHARFIGDLDAHAGSRVLFTMFTGIPVIAITGSCWRHAAPGWLAGGQPRPRRAPRRTARRRRQCRRPAGA